MEINVKVPSREKILTIEVDEDNSVRSIVEVVCQELSLGDSKQWRLKSGGDLEPSKTLRELRVYDGDTLELVEAEIEKPESTQRQFQTEPGRIPTKLKSSFSAKPTCNCGKGLKWIKQYDRYYCYSCRKYPPRCPKCKKDLFWIPEPGRYYCNTCTSYASTSSQKKGK